jgi:hypothetical protein
MLLILNFFYEGIYKISYWQSFSLWLHHAPLLKQVWIPLTYLIPIGEIFLSLALLAPSYRVKALYFAIAILIIFILWIISAYLFTSRLFWPYHAMWKKPTWMQKMLISLGLCWLAYIAVLLSKNNPTKENIKSSLRNLTANAQ